ncbi:coiled-coil domain-containing protein [Acrasis kona]|uniref:Coiled-coil domain-containing protein n=1 Tax=Acrasis kona TaxID=1008807 RepID=A0AAW2Z7Y2_9EUKA
MAEWGAPKYYPPEWEPKKGSINKFRGVHALRERARKFETEGILIIRFEMPFNIWCGNCNDMIGKGTRFNAEKSHDGNYLSTRIYKFVMKCAKCKNKITIHTDPKACDYVVTEGGKRKEERFEFDVESDNVATFTSAEEIEERKNNGIAQLEHLDDDLKKSQNMVPVLTQIQSIRDDSWRNDYDASQLLRKKNRQRKKQDLKQVEHFRRRFGNDFIDQETNQVTLPKETQQDRIIASTTIFKTKPSNPIKNIFDKPCSIQKPSKTVQAALMSVKKPQHCNNHLTIKAVKTKSSSLSLLSDYK